VSNPKEASNAVSKNHRHVEHAFQQRSGDPPEFCGAHDRHEYELYLAVENIDQTRTRTKTGL